MTKLPFLKPQGPATQRKYAGESRYSFDEPSEMVEQALDELMEAIHSKDHKKMMEAVMALIESVISKEKGLEDGNDEKTQSDA